MVQRNEANMKYVIRNFSNMNEFVAEFESKEEALKALDELAKNHDKPGTVFQLGEEIDGKGRFIASKKVSDE